MSDYNKPLPKPTATDRPYWDALRRHELRVQQCEECGARQWYPRETCSTCTSFALAWSAVDPVGTVFSFTTQHHPTGSKFDVEVPFTVVVVQIENAPEIKLVGPLLDVDSAGIHVNMPVHGEYFDATDEFTLLVFRPR
jgi:uncharacterized OB-fold protein